MPDFKFFKSEDIKVFPCSYRGYQEINGNNEVTTVVFDPESRMLTERNFITAGYNIYKKEDSYILDYNLAAGSDYLEVVIKGYYFRINNFSSYMNRTWTHLGLMFRSINITSDDTTPVLKNLTVDGSLYLDNIVVDSNNTFYEFRGLGMYTPGNDDPNGLYNLEILDLSDEETINILNSSKRLNINLVDLNAESGHIITSADRDTGSKAITGDKEFNGNVTIQGDVTKKVEIKQHNVITDLSNVTNKLSTNKTLKVMSGSDSDSAYTFKIYNKQVYIDGTNYINLPANKYFEIYNKLSNVNLKSVFRVSIDSNNNSSIEINGKTVDIKKTNGNSAVKLENDKLNVDANINTDIKLETNKTILSSTDKQILAPDYTSAQANYVLTINSNGNGLVWRKPYHEDITSAS